MSCQVCWNLRKLLIEFWDKLSLNFEVCNVCGHKWAVSMRHHINWYNLQHHQIVSCWLLKCVSVFCARTCSIFISYHSRVNTLCVATSGKESCVSKASRLVFNHIIVYTTGQVAMFASNLWSCPVPKEGICCRADSSDALVPTQPASAGRLLSDELEAVPGEGHTSLPNSHRDGSVVRADLLQRYALTGPLCLPQWTLPSRSLVPHLPHCFVCNDTPSSYESWDHPSS